LLGVLAADDEESNSKWYEELDEFLLVLIGEPKRFVIEELAIGCAG